MRHVGSLASTGFHAAEGVMGSSARLTTRMATCTLACTGTRNGSVTA